MFDNLFRPKLIVGALPVTLTNGTTADATQVMSDLNWIVNQVNANAAPLATAALVNANNNFTAVQSGVAASAAANFPIASQVQNWAFNSLSSTLGTNALTGRISALPLGAYAVGQVFSFLPSQGNTASATLNIDSLGSTVIKSFGRQLVGGELGSGVVTSGAIVQVVSTGAQPVVELLSESARARRGAAKAWVRFGGVGGAAIQAALNVGSVTYNGTGDYTINFTIPFASGTSYVGVSMGTRSAGANGDFGVAQDPNNVPTASAFRILTHAESTYALEDAQIVFIVFFGD